jgi:hypothetical protein
MSDAMSQPTSPPTPLHKPRGLKLPPWLATVLCLLIIGAGGWVFARLWAGSAPADLSQYEAASDRRRANFGNRQGGPGNGQRAAIPAEGQIVRRGQGADVRLPGARARFTKAQDAWRVEPIFLGSPIIPEADRAASRARWAATNRPQDTAAVNVTPEQLAKLKEIENPPQMVLTDAERQRLIALFTQHEAASPEEKPKLAKELTDAFRAAADSARPATLSAHAKAGEAVRAILSPQQIETLGKR